jgi:hypothetical protein
MKNRPKKVLCLNLSQKFSSNLTSTKLKEERVLSKHFPKPTIWKSIIAWLFPYLKKSEKLTKQFFEAKVKQEQNVAKKINAQTNLLKIKETKEFNIIINEIFSDDRLPDIAKQLKLAKLIKNNPEVIAQLNFAKNIIENIQLKKKVISDKNAIQTRTECQLPEKNKLLL